MQNFGWAKIAVYYAKNDPYAPGYREALDHAGLRYEVIEDISARDIARFHVLVLCGTDRLNHGEATSVVEWMAKGNSLICSGSAWGMENLLGLQAETVHLSSAIIESGKADRIWPEGATHVRFFGGAGKRNENCEVLAKAGEFVAIGRRKSGRAHAIFLAPHVGQTIKLMQYGKSVECDAIGPSDGSAVLDNGVLRAEDGTVLDYETDRCTTDGTKTKFFGYPHSDAIREIFIRAIVQTVDARGLSTPIFWHWPRGAQSAAMLTVDCQEFEREHVDTLRRLFSMFGTPATWMVALPGYSVDVYRAMKAWEHEVGLLYLTDDNAGWNEEKFKVQWSALSRLSAYPNLISARAYDGRWKGWKTFYDMCEVGGARASLSKGGRQPGTSGFLFGTSHPFVPTRKDGTLSIVTEIPYTVYNPGLVTPDAVCEKIAQQTVMRYGMLHTALPSSAIAEPEAAISLRRLLSVCKHLKTEFMLPELVHRFERGRRQLRVTQKLLEDEGTLVIASDTDLPGLTVLVNGPRLTAAVRSKEIHVETVERYGCQFNMIILDVHPKSQIELRVWPNRIKAAA